MLVEEATMRLRASRAEGSWNWKPDQPGKQLEDHRDLGRIGIRGAVLVKAACAGLLARDSALLADGAPARLRRLPAALLKMETAVAATAAATGLRPLRDPTPRCRL